MCTNSSGIDTDAKEVNYIYIIPFNTPPKIDRNLIIQYRCNQIEICFLRILYALEYLQDDIEVEVTSIFN
jgi:hypothetical protein